MGKDYHGRKDSGNGGNQDKLTFLRTLMEPGVSLERAYHEIHRRHLEGRAAASTVEALMLGLRERGTRALRESPVQGRLAALSEQQLHEAARRLEKLDPEIARAWTADEVVRLVEAWAACHGQ